MSEEEFRKVSPMLRKVIMFQIILYTFFTLFFFITVYQNQIIYLVSLTGIAILLFLLFFINRKIKLASSLIYWIFFIIVVILIILPINLFEYLHSFLIPNPVGLTTSFDGILFIVYYGLLTLFSIIAEFIIALYFYLKQPIIIEQQRGFGIWDYFLINTTWKKILILIGLLTVSAVAEEIIFRYILLNIFISFKIPLLVSIILASLLFGLAHYQNGGWIYTVNSSFAGFIFSVTFIQMGIITSWILHFLWNFLILFQMFIPKLYIPRKKKKREEEGETQN